MFPTIWPAIHTAIYSGGSRGGARVPPYFIPNWGSKGRKKFFWYYLPPFVRVWMSAPPPPYLKVWIRHWYISTERKRRLAISHHQKNEENHTIRTCSFISCSCCCNWVNSWVLISGLALAFDWHGAVAKAKEKMTLVTSWKKKKKEKEKKKKGIKLFDLFYST